MGLAFLTRPEAFLLFFLMPLALLVENRRELHTLWRSVIGYCAVFTAILCMNTVLIHHFTGTWQLAAKTSSALTDTLSYYLKIPGLNQIPGVKPIGYLDLIRDYPNLILTNPINNLKTIFETILPASFWLLAMIGFLAGGFQKKDILQPPFPALLVCAAWRHNCFLLYQCRLCGTISADTLSVVRGRWASV